MTSAIVEIFNQSQHNSDMHSQCVLQLEKLYSEMDINEFTETFLKCILNSLKSDYKVKNPYVEQTYEFLIKFILIAKPVSQNVTFVEHVLKRLIKYHECGVDNVRYRLCEFINKLLWKVNDELDHDLKDIIVKAMLDRFLDVKSAISMQAANVLYHFQQPNDESCIVTSTFLKNIININRNTRFAVVNNLDLTVNNVEEFLDRCRDIDDRIRLKAFSKFCEFPANMLQIAQRQEILQGGLSDKTRRIRQYVTKTLIPFWLESYEGKVLKFMKAIQLDADKKEIEVTQQITKTMLKALFSLKTMKEMCNELGLVNCVVPHAELTWEKSMLWENILSNIEEEQHKTVVPETVDFCDYIQSYVHSSDITNAKQWQKDHIYLILSHLIGMANHCDVSDEASRKKLQDVCVDLIENVELDTYVLDMILKLLQDLVKNKEEHIVLSEQILSHIRMPLMQLRNEDELRKLFVELADVKVKLNCLQDEQEKTIEAQNFLKANELKSQIKSLQTQKDQLIHDTTHNEIVSKKNDPKTVSRFMEVAGALLRIDWPIGNIDELYENACKDLVIMTEPEIRCKVLKVLALIAYGNKSFVDQTIQLVSIPIACYKNKISGAENVPACILDVCIAACADLIVLYGTSVMSLVKDDANDNDSDDSNDNAIERSIMKITLKDYVEVIVTMADEIDEDLSLVAARAIVKLFVRGRIHSAVVLSRVFLKWLSPSTPASIRSVFQSFINNINEFPNAAEQLEEVFIPIIQTICDAPPTSPLCSLVPINVGKLLLDITGPSVIKDCDLHLHLAYLICDKLLNEELSNKCREIFAKLLPKLCITEGDGSADELIRFGKRILKEYENKVICNNVGLFINQLEGLFLTDQKLEENATATS